MKKKGLLTAILALTLAVCMMTSVFALSVTAQETTEINSSGELLANQNVNTTYVITVYWDDNDNALGLRPDNLLVYLEGSPAMGVSYFELNEDNHWEYVRNSLPVYYFKGSATGKITYSYSIVNLPEEYTVSIVQEGNWFKATCSLDKSVLPVQTYYLGDANNDKDINVIDATLIQRYDVGYSVPDIDMVAADINGDNNVDIVDATFIQRYDVGTTTSRYEIGKEFNY